MDLTTLLSTTAGKAIVGAAVAAAGLGGLTAAGAVELPDLSDEAVEVEQTPADPDAVVAQTPAEADPQADRSEQTDADQVEAEDTEAEDTEAADVESQAGGLGVDGEEVSTDAQDGGVDGQEISDDAIAGTPAEDQVPEDRGSEAAPDDAGTQADEHQPELPEQAEAGAANRP